MKTIQLEQSWLKRLQIQFDQPYMHKLREFLLIRKQHRAVIYPAGPQIFNALNSTPFDTVRVVILGQDPYHGQGQAHGLCFSVSDGIKLPPSLANIFKELNTDLNIPVPIGGNLEKWARQGILLLNASLTVRANDAGSHQKKGWEEFTDEVIQKISGKNEHLVFILWGRFAQAKSDLIDENKHLILKAAHPSPFSAYNGFFGCKHFSKTNEYLKGLGKRPIVWDLNVD